MELLGLDTRTMDYQTMVDYLEHKDMFKNSLNEINKINYEITGKMSKSVINGRVVEHYLYRYGKRFVNGNPTINNTNDTLVSRHTKGRYISKECHNRSGYIGVDTRIVKATIPK